jgi:hypothetical protein
VVIPDSARWSKPSTGGRTEDEAHNFDRIVNSWYLTPEGMKFSHYGDIHCALGPPLAIENRRN